MSGIRCSIPKLKCSFTPQKISKIPLIIACHIGHIIFYVKKFSGGHLKFKKMFTKVVSIFLDALRITFFDIQNIVTAMEFLQFFETAVSF